MYLKTGSFTVIFILVLLNICTADTTPVSDASKKYVHLPELIKLEDRESPLFAFNEFSKSLDQDLHKASIEYFNQHPEIIRKIKADLDNKPVRWRLEKISHRLLYVPETRQEYAALFEGYCKDVIDAMLKLTELNNPYTQILTPGIDTPVHSEREGFNAFIVHNLAREYVATYVFSNEDRKEIGIEVTGKVLLNEVGSFSSYIFWNENGSFDVTRDHYTIWQNSAKNPYTVLMTPVEETLHIALRQYTEKAIMDGIKKTAIDSVKQIEVIVEDWMCVEEAIVGGLVHSLLPSLIEKYMYILPESLIESDIATKGRFKKYRHLRKGIDIVERLGYRTSIKMYQDNPTAFRSLLM